MKLAHLAALAMAFSGTAIAGGMSFRPPEGQSLPNRFTCYQRQYEAVINRNYELVRDIGTAQTPLTERKRGTFSIRCQALVTDVGRSEKFLDVGQAQQGKPVIISNFRETMREPAHVSVSCSSNDPLLTGDSFDYTLRQDQQGNIEFKDLGRASGRLGNTQALRDAGTGNRWLTLQPDLLQRNVSLVAPLEGVSSADLSFLRIQASIRDMRLDDGRTDTMLAMQVLGYPTWDDSAAARSVLRNDHHTSTYSPDNGIAMFRQMADASIDNRTFDCAKVLPESAMALDWK